jgi:hypothetical protein
MIGKELKGVEELRKPHRTSRTLGIPRTVSAGRAGRLLKLKRGINHPFEPNPSWNLDGRLMNNIEGDNV